MEAGIRVSPRCTICGAEETQIARGVWSPYVNCQYTLYHCLRCVSYFFDASQHPVDLQDLYNGHYRGVEEQFRWSPILALQVRRIRRLLTKGSQHKLDVLDIGCNTGRFLLHWGAEHNLHGVEVSHRAAAIAEQRGIRVYRGFVEQIDFQKQFDVVCCFALLEHLRDPHSFLERLASLAKPGGVLAVLVPTIECGLRQRLDRQNVHWHMYSPPEHLAFYSRSFLDWFFSRQGYTLRRRRYSCGGFSLAYYARWRSNYVYLHETSHYRLRAYYEATKKPPGVSNMVERGLSALTHVIDLATPVGAMPYFDHMYSYWQRDRERDSVSAPSVS